MLLACASNLMQQTLIELNAADGAFNRIDLFDRSMHACAKALKAQP